MTENQLKGYVLRLFKFKLISSKQFMVARSNLEKIKASDPLFYYFNMGKLQTSFGNTDAAIFCLKKTIELKSDHSSAYYNLYKCYVKKGDIDEAFESLGKVLKHNKRAADFNFPIQIMRAMQSLDVNYLNYLNSDFNVSEETKIGYNDLSDNEQLAKLYKLVIQAFNNKDYVICLQKLRTMNVIIKEANYPMEVDTLISLVKLLKDKEAISCKRTLYDKSMEKSSDESFCKLQIRLFALGYYDQGSYLRMAKEVIGEDIWKAKKILDEACKNPNFSQYLDIIEYLNGFIREKNAFMILPEEKQEEFISRRLKAKSLYKNKRNDKSLEEYSSLKQEFGLPICDYYIGKIYFRQGEFIKAKEAFLSYLEQGGVKSEKAYGFLGKIAKIQKNMKEAKWYFDMIHKISNVFIYDFDCLSDKNDKKKRLKEDKYDQNDEVKRKKSRSIKMSEEDFADIETFDGRDFYAGGLSEKLNIIRGLLQSGNNKLANKLYKEVQKECTSEDRAKINQFDRNRKLYKNQNRTFSS
ncbi:MAG: tetratricopeptide repeat protein [Bacilli bacterium]|nr:tetratricopeptide repeat protein [Bacilli bacterium]